MVFHPRFVTWGCPSCTKDYKEDECFDDGKYCAPNHAKDAFNQVKGTDILLENLRETCLHRRLVEKEQEDLWWDYMKYAHQECYNFISKQCSKVAIMHIGESWAENEKCVTDSF